MSDKTELRQNCREKLAGLDPVTMADFNSAITTKFLSSQGFMPHSNIALYMPLKGEVSCTAIIQTLTRQGHTICLPAVPGRDIPLVFRQYRPGDPLTRSILGPFEPTPQAREIIPDVLVIPMLGFNREGYRLGYGTGFYDRTIHSLRQTKPIKTIGLAFSQQELTDLPVEPHDIPMDIIITETDLIKSA